MLVFRAHVSQIIVHGDKDVAKIWIHFMITVQVCLVETLSLL